MLTQAKYYNACEASIRDAAKRHDMNVVELSVMPDHVHCIVQCPQRLSASDAAKILKGCSAREMFKIQPKFRLRYPRGHFWSERYHVNTVGEANLKEAIDYVRAPHNDPRQTNLTQYN